MRRFITFTALICFGALMFASVGQAENAKCSPLPSPPAAYATAAAVFVGKVKSQGQMFSMTNVGCIVDKLVTFSVEKAYFGVTDKEWTIENSVANLDFKDGETYLVYAYQEQPGGVMAMRACSRTRLLTEAQEDLLFLDDPASTRGVTIGGSVVRTGKAVPVEGLTVRVRGNGKTFDLVTDEAGKYSVGGLGAGEYKINLRLPWRLKGRNSSRTLSLADRGRVDENFAVSSRFAWR